MSGSGITLASLLAGDHQVAHNMATDAARSTAPSFAFVPPPQRPAPQAPAHPPTPMQPAQPAAPAAAAEQGDGTTHRCSQCKQVRPLDHFPTRLTTLQPFLVCKSHQWYWTPAKRELHWAPEGVSSLRTVCSEVGEVVGGRRAAGSWIVVGEEEDRSDIVQKVSDVKDWIALPVAVRKSRAAGAAPPRPYHYQLKARDDQGPTWRLVVTLHEAERKFVVAFKEDVGRKAGTWAKKEKTTKTDSATPQPQEGGADEQQQQQQAPQEAAPSALDIPFPHHFVGEKRSSPGDMEDGGALLQQSSGVHYSDALELLPGQTDVHAKASGSSSSHSSGFATNGAAHHVNEILVDYPAAKRPRRVEPVAPASHLQRHLSNSTSTMPLGFASPLPPPSTSQSILVHPPTPPRTTNFDSNLVAPRAAVAYLPSSNSNSGRSNSIDATSFYGSFAPPPAAHLSTPTQHRPSHARSSIQPLTLDQLLASPYTDPPTIPLRQRTMQLNAAAYAMGQRGRSVSEGARSGSVAPPARDKSRSASREVEREVESAGAAAANEGVMMGELEDEEEEEEEAVETGDEEEEEEEESEDDGGDDGGDWLTGFVKGQLGGVGASQEEVDELESGEEESGAEDER